MSVLYPEQVDEWWINAPTPWRCIECGRPIAPPLVYWQGAETLMLHVECAAMLGPHLIADAREAQLAMDPEPVWRRRAVTAVRHRLETEEWAAA